MGHSGKIPANGAGLPEKISLVHGVAGACGIAVLLFLFYEMVPALRAVYLSLGEVFVTPKQGMQVLASIHICGLLLALLVAAHRSAGARREVETGTLRVIEAEAVAESALWLTVAFTFLGSILQGLLVLRWQLDGAQPSGLALFGTLVASLVVSLVTQLVALILDYGKKTQPYQHTLGGLRTYAGVPVILSLIPGLTLQNLALFLGLTMVAKSLQPIGYRLRKAVALDNERRNSESKSRSSS